MEIEEKNGVTYYSNYEIDKAFKQYRYGVPIADFFRVEAKAYRYGKIGYIGKLKEELEHFEEQPVFIDDSYDYQIECVAELKKAILDLQDLNIQAPAKQVEMNLTPKQRRKPKQLVEYRFNTIFPESVPDLYQQLNTKELIKTTEIHFNWAFGSGKDKPEDFKPIIWKGDNTLLSYLIDSICQNKNKWKVAEYIFDVTGLAQTFKNCKGNPRGKELIDEIILEIG